MKYIFLFLITFFNRQNLDSKINTIHLSDISYNYTISISVAENVSLKSTRVYYWYKARGVHHSIGNYNGNLLDGEFIKSYKSNQLAEKGLFKKGLKHKEWLEWYESGNLKSISHWNKGQRKGLYKSYNESGVVTFFGKYNNNQKDGIWIYPLKKDTLYYKKGILLEEKPLGIFQRTKLFLNKIFKKKESKKDLE